MSNQTCLKCPKKYITLIGGLICYISLGSQSITSTTSPYYLSYLQVRTNSSEMARYSNTIYISNLLRLTQALSAIIFGSLITKYKFTLKQMSFCGGIVISCGFLLSYFTIKYSFLLFLFSFSFMFGAGMGMTFIVPVSLVTKVLDQLLTLVICQLYKNLSSFSGFQRRREKWQRSYSLARASADLCSPRFQRTISIQIILHRTGRTQKTFRMKSKSFSNNFE